MEDKVLLGHGSGGTMMNRIIDEVFFEAYAGEELLRGDDAAVLPGLAPGERLAFSTDSFVVSPHFFPGGDIGRLAVCGTVNDIATSGAKPLYLSCGFILEEGYSIEDLRRICASMASAAKEAGVALVTGDTKVVNRGHGDGVFINTSGVGVVPEGVDLSGSSCCAGDAVLVSGTLGDHGITIMSCREGLSFSVDVQSDAAPLNHLIADVLAAACEMLGYDPLQVANEGKMVCVVAANQAEAALSAMKANPYGVDAAVIGKVTTAQADRGPAVFVKNAFGGRHILDMLVGEQLPRIC